MKIKGFLIEAITNNRLWIRKIFMGNKNRKIRTITMIKIGITINKINKIGTTINKIKETGTMPLKTNKIGITIPNKMLKFEESTVSDYLNLNDM